jgi:hypothetical protein
VLLVLPAMAGAVRSASDQEISEFKAAARVVENARCMSALLRAGASSSCLPPRENYEPLITEARVSTIDETWATAYVAPAPHSSEAATAVFRKETQQAIVNGVPEARGVWLMVVSGDGCDLGQELGMSHGTVISLMPDLVLARGCTPVIPTKVRCLDKFRTSLLALEKPMNCAVAGPENSLFPDWMNIRELRWHRWGNEEKAWGLGVIRELPGQLAQKMLSASTSGSAISPAVPLAPIRVRLVTSEKVSCGTADFYSRLRVISPFGQFEVTLPTCPDQFFAPR